MQGTEGVPTEAYKRTPQGETTEGNAADDTLMVNQGTGGTIDKIYFDQKSEYQVGDPQARGVLEKANVVVEYEVEFETLSY